MTDVYSVLNPIIGKRIADLRKFKNDNQQELADKIGLKRSSISNIESGRQQITLHVLYRIAQVYETDIYNLLPRVNDIASKVSLEIKQVKEIFKQNDVGFKTQNEILGLLK